jgi:drug/metabolite transporter (DMT)-like permease
LQVSKPGAVNPPAPMLYLLLTPLLYAYSSLGGRHVQRLGLNVYSVGAFNYVFSALAYAILYWLKPEPPAQHVLYGGVILGVLFAVTYLFFVPTLYDRGVSVMAALCQLSALVPMAGSLLIWHEQPTPVRWTGAVLCLAAMPMLALDKGITDDSRLSWRRMFIFTGLVVFNGGVLLALKWFQELSVPRQFDGFMLTTFCTATVVMALCWPLYRGVLSHPVVAWGAAISISYIGAAMMIVKALRFYEGVVVFPFAEATAVALTVAFAALVWKEIPGRLGLAGIGVVTVAAVLINM